MQTTKKLLRNLKKQVQNLEITITSNSHEHISLTESAIIDVEIHVDLIKSDVILLEKRHELLQLAMIGLFSSTTMPRKTALRLRLSNIVDLNSNECWDNRNILE